MNAYRIEYGIAAWFERHKPRFGFVMAFWIAVGIGALVFGTRL